VTYSISCIKIGDKFDSQYVNKLYDMFVKPELRKYTRKIFFDLDVIIHGDISDILNHDADFALVYSTWKGLPFKIKYPKKSLFNSSVIVWKDASHVYEHFMKSPKDFVSKYAGTDDFYHNEKIKRTQLPHCIYSYRDGEKPNQYNSFVLRKHKSIALLHQKPKNHELNIYDHPILKYWNGNFINFQHLEFYINGRWFCSLLKQNVFFKS